MPSSSREERDCPSSSKKETVKTMASFFHTSLESCGGDHGMSSKEEGAWPSISKREGSMTIREDVVMAYLLEEGVWPPSSERERSMTMAIFLPSEVQSC